MVKVSGVEELLGARRPAARLHPHCLTGGAGLVRRDAANAIALMYTASFGKKTKSRQAPAPADVRGKLHENSP